MLSARDICKILAPGIWYLDGSAIQPTDTSFDLGSVTTPIANGYFTNLYGDGSNLTGIDAMVYPGAGIAISTGSAWGTSITDSSANWNTAYGWGNHALAGYIPYTGASTNVDLNSKNVITTGKVTTGNSDGNAGFILKYNSKLVFDG